MFFHIPPALPPAAISGSAFVQVEMVSTDSDDCTQGSRDCFPKDRVGVVSQTTMLPIPMQSSDIEEIVRAF
ncbi:hypothetical protein IQ273_16005 [Nodosilinea sp. LEGE 07298]|uniref:hypothetical protein n=1 Tax=Nodosilinea sp. LEGE 07298 TaxID=2777970 RepID=UPI001881943C|nr:hypothetical protein [Nodosilinea sp. LEGE 07298]MBE9110916.1 hypothetical protein [Nodosilinea sp. LEGE 07298]